MLGAAASPCDQLGSWPSVASAHHGPDQARIFAIIQSEKQCRFVAENEDKLVTPQACLG